MLAILGVLFLGLASPAFAAQAIQSPEISSSPANASQILDRALASFSIEYGYLPSFGGNISHPNELTRRLMQRLVERTGVGPDVRPGGITIDSSQYNPDSPALTLVESSSGGIYSSTFGPALYESLNVFPSSSKFIVSVNLGNDTIKLARDEIAAAIQHLGWDRIRALELGNEPDHYAGGQRPAAWSSSDYTAQFIGWTSVLTRNLTLPKGIFQAGSFADDPPTASMTTEEIIDEGAGDTGAVEVYSQHMQVRYQFSTCDPIRDAIATLPHLVNHTNITSYVDLWKPQVAAARSVGKPLVIGEYSSVSCSGKENVTDTYGQALWLADSILYSASINITRMYMHQGATLVLQSGTQANSPGFSWYDLWYPVDSDRYGTARAGPSFVAYLLITEAVGSSGHSQLALVATPANPQLAMYAIWDKGKLSRIAILNLANRYVSTSADDAENLAVTVDISKYVSGSKVSKVQVKRMTAPGIDSKDSDTATWAGQSYTNGTANGKEVVEGLNRGQVKVGGSEGVLVILP
ncbi:hypothetical protein EVG20_g1847 [Dentipellis fragilis]|uniref:Beta-glucuronidase C-terminal domain-containing protein n=1 Tax=Dentipellis fragilis TaxID=205917 RepID=A0A4Y9Z8F1_9AGAM|nr:hypothetical protein EVG20_g1847 [Dentipellis fragilis]